MKSPIRWIKRRCELFKHSLRRMDVEHEFGAACGYPVKLVAAPTKGGYDEIYYALNQRKRFAVVRINSPYKTQNDPVSLRDPGIPLDANGRLEHEWNVYHKLTKEHIAPRPLWKSDHAIACSWINWQRASIWLTKYRRDFWSIAERIFPAVAKMHQCGVTHLDLNLGNILVEPNGPGVIIIDFEFGPADWVSKDQQKAFDYLRLLDDCVKPRRGGRQLLADLDRMEDILNRCVDKSCRHTDLTFVFAKLKRLTTRPQLCETLRKIFQNL